jgi:hypothetical protein
MTIAASTRDASAVGTRRRRAQPAILVGASILLFALLHASLFIAARTPPDSIGGLATDVGLSILRFVGVLAPTLVLAAQGRRVLLAAPYVLWVILIPIVLFQDRIPRPLGLGWTPSPGTPSASSAWVLRPMLGVVVDATFVVIPGLWAARAGSYRESQPRPSSVMQICALALSLLALLALVQTTETTGSYDLTDWGAGIQLGSYFLLGILAGWRDARIGSFVLAAPIALNADWIQVTLPVFSLIRLMSPAVPFLVATAAGLGSRPLAAWLDSLRRRPPRTLLAWVLLLNLADVVLTLLLTRLDGAVEANPIVRATGLPAKLILVSIAAAIVARMRPAALIWPVILMLGVTVWHVSGLALAVLT